MLTVLTHFNMLLSHRLMCMPIYRSNNLSFEGLKRTLTMVFACVVIKLTEEGKKDTFHTTRKKKGLYALAMMKEKHWFDNHFVRLCTTFGLHTACEGGLPHNLCSSYQTPRCILLGKLGQSHSRTRKKKICSKLFPHIQILY